MLFPKKSISLLWTNFQKSYFQLDPKYNVRGGALDLGRGGKWEREMGIRVIESDFTRRTKIPLKKHEEWCCEHLHFVKKEQEGERKGGPGELEGV